MFNVVTEKSHKYLQDHIDELAATCEKDLSVKEMVRYILAYSDEMAYGSRGSADADIGREIIGIIWSINGLDLSNMANSYHFSPGWADKLNGFIGNYINDDSAFDFEQKNFTGVFEFKSANDTDGRWLQNPMIIIEAAKANRAYYSACDNESGVDGLARRLQTKVDGSKVFALLK